MAVYAQHVSTRLTPQGQAIPGTTQVPNSAGGFAWSVDCWTRLNRFLILGSEKGSYYASEKALTIEASDAVRECAQSDPDRTLAAIVSVSDGGRAPKNDPAIFALAQLAGTHPQVALPALPLVCRTGTHLFQFVANVEHFRGWGRALRRAIAAWYESKAPRDLAYQLTKYQQRDGWSHRDLLRLSHPKSDERSPLYRWAVGKEVDPDTLPEPIMAFERAKRAESAKEVAALITKHRLVRECVPTQFLGDPAVWDAMLADMPVTAMLRNLAKMTAVGLLAPMSEAARTVRERLTNADALKRGRVHPLAVLLAQRTYAQGHGDRGKLKWQPVPQISDALNDAFYGAFAAVEPTNKRWLLALDVSGSMGSPLSGTSLSCREASACLAMVTARTEANHAFVAFTNGGFCAGPSAYPGWQSGISPLAISARQRLDDVVKAISGIPFGGTDCALPMLYAIEQNIPVDVFVVLTDSETWAGDVHPSQALTQYRQKTGINAKLIVVGMVANKFSIADPNDGGMLDVVGCDTTCPQVMAEFAKGL